MDKSLLGDKSQHRFHVRTMALQPGCTCHLQNFENPRPHPTPVKPEPLGVLPGSNVFQTPPGNSTVQPHLQVMVLVPPSSSSGHVLAVIPFSIFVCSLYPRALQKSTHLSGIGS